MSIVSKVLAEFLGTAWLVLAGCGSAVLATHVLTSGANPHDVGIGFLGVALAYGLAVLTMAYAIGHISGCHINPAVTCGLVASGRFSVAELIPYLIAQVAGGLAGAFVLYVIVSGQPGGFSFFDEKLTSSQVGAFATNGFGDHSPRGFSLVACFVAEAVLTFFFVLIALGATSGRAPAGFSGVAVGLAMTTAYLVLLPITNGSLNPARSTGPALVLAFLGGGWWAVQELWLFWAAPIAGAVVAGIVFNLITPTATESPEPTRAA